MKDSGKPASSTELANLISVPLLMMLPQLQIKRAKSGPANQRLGGGGGQRRGSSPPRAARWITAWGRPAARSALEMWLGSERAGRRGERKQTKRRDGSRRGSDLEWPASHHLPGGSRPASIQRQGWPAHANGRQASDSKGLASAIFTCHLLIFFFHFFLCFSGQ